MRIDVKLGDSTKTIEVSTKMKQENEYLDKIEAMEKASNSNDGKEIGTTREFMRFENDMAVECSTLSKEEYDDLCSEDRNKIKKALRGMIFPHATGDPAKFF